MKKSCVCILVFVLTMICLIGKENVYVLAETVSDNDVEEQVEKQNYDSNENVCTENDCLSVEENGYEGNNDEIIEDGVGETDENILFEEGSGGVKTKLDSVLKNYPVGSTWKGSWGGTKQCFGFARMIFSKVFGCEMPTAYKGSNRYIYSSNTNVILVGQLAGNSVTAHNVQAMFSTAKVGDIIQGCGSEYGQHTMILYSVTSKGITYYDCNSGGTNQVKYGSRTWASMASRYSGYSSSYGNNGISIYRAKNYDSVDYVADAIINVPATPSLSAINIEYDSDSKVRYSSQVNVGAGANSVSVAISNNKGERHVYAVAISNGWVSGYVPLQDFLNTEAAFTIEILLTDSMGRTVMTSAGFDNTTGVYINARTIELKVGESFQFVGNAKSNVRIDNQNWDGGYANGVQGIEITPDGYATAKYPGEYVVYFNVTYTQYYPDGSQKVSISMYPAVIKVSLATPQITKIKATSNATVDIAFSGVTGADGYRIYRKVVGSNSYSCLKELGASTFNFADNNVEPEQRYYYKIVAYKILNGIEYLSSESRNAEVGVNSITISNLFVTIDNPKEVLLEWDKLNCADGYYIIKRYINGNKEKTVELTTKNSYYLDRDVIPGVEYYYTIIAMRNNKFLSKDGVEICAVPLESAENDFPSDSQVNLSQIEAFVRRMYNCALNREAEDAGLQDWCNRLTTQQIDGAGISQGFIGSPEFQNRNLSDLEYLMVLYETFFNRWPDEEGLNYWINYLWFGGSRQEVLSGFVNSQEFSNLCDSYGIARGTMQADGSSIYRPGVRNFVLRMYTKALNRNGETLGVEDWTNRINTGSMSPEDVAKSFFLSREFTNRNLSNAEYVETLYETFMDRASDKEGKRYWLNKLNGGMSREQVLEGFSRSVEFSRIMRSYGL